MDGNQDYIVCNPTIEQWVVVSSASYLSPREYALAYLVFDLAISPHFHLFHLWDNANIGVIEVCTYSSETEVWINCTSEQMLSEEQGAGGWKL